MVVNEASLAADFT